MARLFAASLPSSHDGLQGCAQTPKSPLRPTRHQKQSLVSNANPPIILVPNSLCFEMWEYTPLKMWWCPPKSNSVAAVFYGQFCRHNVRIPNHPKAEPKSLLHTMQKPPKCHLWHCLFVGKTIAQTPRQTLFHTRKIHTILRPNLSSRPQPPFSAGYDLPFSPFHSPSIIIMNKCLQLRACLIETAPSHFIFLLFTHNCKRRA